MFRGLILKGYIGANAASGIADNSVGVTKSGMSAQIRQGSIPDVSSWVQTELWASSGFPQSAFHVVYGCVPMPHFRMFRSWASKLG
jgi:hypothetical protein